MLKFHCCLRRLQSDKTAYYYRAVNKNAAETLSAQQIAQLVNLGQEIDKPDSSFSRFFSVVVIH